MGAGALIGPSDRLARETFVETGGPAGDWGGQERLMVC